jgi:DHA1 family bicyclomycin/chloramphenicol resistance-like MFS transporter
MVRDTQPVQSAARVLATMVAALAIAPMLAPTLGSFLIGIWDWHAIFVALAVVGVVLSAIAAMLPETRPPDQRVAFHPSGVLSTMRDFLATPGTRLPTAIVCIGFAGQFSFISTSPFIFVAHFHASESRFAIYFGVTALALMAGATIGRRLLATDRPPRVVVLGTRLAAVGGVLTAVGANVTALGAAGIIAPMVFYFVGVGLSLSPAAALAMDPVPRIAGVASAVIGALQMLSGAAAGWLVTRLGGGDPRALGIAVATFGVGALVLARRIR